jgi:hypothetical protein
LLFPPPPPSSIDPNTKVAALIDNVTGWWNYELIHRLFDPGDVVRICSVMVSPLMKPDRLVWRSMESLQ